MVDLQRSSYKKVWNDLASSFKKAVIHVTGDATEQQLQAFGSIDSQKIVSMTQINSNDTVLEIGCGVGRLGFCISDACKQWIGCDISGNHNF